MDTLSHERLIALLDYDSETGVFTWRIRPREDFGSLRAANTWNARFAGREAGSKSGVYQNISIDYETFQAHRLAWFYVHGVWPDHIDHDDGNKRRNAIGNLQSVSNAINRKNQATRKDNTSGAQGVYWDKRNGKWMAKIQVSGCTINLGRYHDFAVALAARKDAERLYGFHPNHGRAA